MQPEISTLSGKILFVLSALGALSIGVWLFLLPGRFKKQLRTRGPMSAVFVVVTLFFLASLILVSLYVPDPTSAQWFTFRVACALMVGVAGFFIPGTIKSGAKHLWIIRSSGALGIFVVSFFLTSAISPHISQPKIAIVQIPDIQGTGPDSTFLISGVAKTSFPADMRVLVYASVSGRWYVQPLPGAAVRIATDGSWSASVHPGTSYAALLARASFKPAPTLGALPSIGEDILAIDVQETPIAVTSILSGRVLDADTTEPVVGAKVMCEGTTVVTTNAEGRFSCSVPNNPQIRVRIDRNGYQTFEGIIQKDAYQSIILTKYLNH